MTNTCVVTIQLAHVGVTFNGLKLTFSPTTTCCSQETPLPETSTPERCTGNPFDGFRNQLIATTG